MGLTLPLASHDISPGGHSVTGSPKDCLSSIWGSQSPSACEKDLQILELLWKMPATLNVACFLCFSTEPITWILWVGEPLIYFNQLQVGDGELWKFTQILGGRLSLFDTFQILPLKIHLCHLSALRGIEKIKGKQQKALLGIRWTPGGWLVNDVQKAKHQPMEVVTLSS